MFDPTQRKLYGLHQNKPLHPAIQKYPSVREGEVYKIVYQKI